MFFPPRWARSWRRACGRFKRKPGYDPPPAALDGELPGSQPHSPLRSGRAFGGETGLFPPPSQLSLAQTSLKKRQPAIHRDGLAGDEAVADDHDCRLRHFFPLPHPADGNAGLDAAGLQGRGHFGVGGPGAIAFTVIPSFAVREA